eukprot:gnl/MRDRNA2_/MRDRNA2_84981_c0_seq7.p1 gnl/MRDRNA2_/MRDRNA2_84981_c0~~gnl/MRDRNA2_/MRDRNA2_84981_c0_seq7.p1  ORF type:complete len:359 (-),score=55.18 gnl/MRDRNA2_/MRDRNA2_84981_c0_seq7:149-1225(-)
MQYFLTVHLVCQMMMSVTMGLRISELPSSVEEGPPYHSIAYDGSRPINVDTGISFAKLLKVPKPDVPRTAFCISGNIRGGHEERAANLLKKSLDALDAYGKVFAYVNPCEARTKPWPWDMDPKTQGKEWVPPPCDRKAAWNSSWFKKILRPEKLQEYTDEEVAAPERNCTNDSPGWFQGVHEGAMGVKRCFAMVRAYEKENNMKFQWVVRVRPDQTSSGTRLWGSEQIRYCPVTELDATKAHLHIHYNGTVQTGGDFLLYDNFAIVPRHLAKTYFTYVDNWKGCPSRKTYVDPGAMNFVFGEEALSSWVLRQGKKFPFTDDCNCHKFPTITCHGGCTGMTKGCPPFPEPFEPWGKLRA